MDLNRKFMYAILDAYGTLKKLDDKCGHSEDRDTAKVALKESLEAMGVKREVVKFDRADFIYMRGVIDSSVKWDLWHKVNLALFLGDIFDES